MVGLVYEQPRSAACAELARQALAARDQSHSPYSRFRVGAAVRTADGAVFRGCNIESCSFSPTVCAERVAIAGAVAAGHRAFSAIAVASDVEDRPVTPCGVCRQFMREFSSDLPILLAKPGGSVCYTSLAELLPASFGPEFLDNQYYVGYVEDDESVDAIMKKFEELERIEKEFSAKQASGNSRAEGEEAPSTAAVGSDGDRPSAASPSGPGSGGQAPGGESGMSAELLEEVFKRTSAFTVRGAMMDSIDLEAMDDIELWEAEAGVPAEWEEEEDYVTLHLDDDALDDEFGVVAPRRRYQRQDAPRRGAAGAPKLSTRDQIIQRYKYMQVRIQDRHGHTFFVSRKVNAVDPSLPTYVRIPPRPIPRSWVKHIRALVDGAESTPRTVVSGVLRPREEPQWARRIDTDVTLAYDYASLGRTFQCVYMDPPLLLPGQEEKKDDKGPRSGYFGIADLAAVPVGELLVPGGFLFAWCEKELLPDMCELAERRWGLRYVENFCWVLQQTNNHIARLDSAYFCRSKVTLLIFRREGELEMRHQRSPDSVFDFIKPRMPGDLNDRKPEFAYTVIETLLPRALCSESEPNPDRLLQLWMPADCHRTHWTTIIQEGQRAQYA
ncbi:hypothetical protein H4R18_004389 [Coemansia javaensis]|uniref:cytidine deaminase n=1 Tax=Coemansia javaensis TaxID=2761396 RepID=A0A9W8H4E2_9FUNG|nr:hypothetical protein H4R18_004389 [Coemansia javaensis]